VNRVDPTELYTVCGYSPDFGFDICFDSTVVGAPACSPDGDCYLYDGDGLTSDGRIELYDRLRDACLFANAQTWHCNTRQDSPEGPEFVLERVVGVQLGFERALAAHGAPTWALNDQSERVSDLTKCIHGHPWECGGFAKAAATACQVGVISCSVSGGVSFSCAVSSVSTALTFVGLAFVETPPGLLFWAGSLFVSSLSTNLSC
jgi:hypothetical protein